MTMFDSIAAVGLDALMALDGSDARYTPAAGTGEYPIRCVFGYGRQDEMGLGDAQGRRTMKHILLRKTGAGAVADPRFKDVISRGDSLNLEDYEIVDFREDNDVAAIAICRRKHRNELTRTGARNPD
jgi:hypothetical protein